MSKLAAGSDGNVQPATPNGFTQVPNAVIHDARLSLGARMTYVMLKFHAFQKGECFVGQEKLALELGVSDRTVRRYVGELKRAGLVTSKSRGQGKTAVYRIADAIPSPVRLVASGEGEAVSAPDRTAVSLQDQRVASSPERTPVSAPLKKKPLKNTQLKNGDNDHDMRAASAQSTTDAAIEVGDTPEVAATTTCYQTPAAQAVLDTFNARLGGGGQPFRGEPWLTMIKSVLDVYSELSLEDHRNLMDAHAADPWWEKKKKGGSATPGVLYKSPKLFGQCLAELPRLAERRAKWSAYDGY